MSPIDWARMRVPMVSSWPGMGRSWRACPGHCLEHPVLGPPFWRARGGDGHLPAEELGSQVGFARHVQADYRVAGRFQLLDGMLLRRVGRAFDGEVDEEAVTPIRGGAAHRLARDGDEALALFASAF